MTNHSHRDRPESTPYYQGVLEEAFRQDQENHLTEVENEIAALNQKGDRLIHLMEIERPIARLRAASQQHDERKEELRQEYETVLGVLESEFLGALVSGNWVGFDQFVEGFKNK